MLEYKKFKANCMNCSIAELCLPVALSDSELSQLDKIIKKRRIIHKGEELFYQDGKFMALYAIRSGSFKTYILNQDSQEQITSFHLPGELLGFDAISKEKHLVTAKALETSSVCEVPFTELLTLAAQLPKLQTQLFRLMSREMDNEMKLQINASAEQRLAVFLQNISSRYKQRGLSSSKFILTMTRQDIANYLGLATETVSRLFKAMQGKGVIQVERREISILDFDKLQIATCQHKAM